MVEERFDDDWVDRYVRDELSPEDEDRFEQRLMEDAGLQARVEAALGIRGVLQQSSATTQSPPAGRIGSNPWTSWALAASVALAAVTTVLLWRENVRNNALREQVRSLQAPRTSVLTVPVDIMRSSGAGSPDVIIQKPADDGAIVLDIELAPRFRGLEQIDFSLQAPDGAPVLAWSATPGADGRAVVVLQPESLPDGLVELWIVGPNGRLNGRRLLEFRAAAE